MAEDSPSVPVGQPRLGVPEVRTVRPTRRYLHGYMGTEQCTGLAAVARTRPMAMAVLSRPGRWETQV